MVQRCLSVAGRSLTVLLLALAGLLLLPGAPASAATTNVDVGDFWYCDSSYQNDVCPTSITQGDSVFWDFAPAGDLHTATHCGDDCNNPTSSPLFDSGARFPGQTYEYTFDTPGTYKYYCVYHPLAMRGEVTVASASVGGVAELPDARPAPAAGEPAYGPSRLATALGFAAGASLLAAAAGGIWYARARLR